MRILIKFRPGLFAGLLMMGIAGLATRGFPDHENQLKGKDEPKNLKTIHDHRTGKEVEKAEADGTVYEFRAAVPNVNFWKSPHPEDGVWMESKDKKKLLWISSTSRVIATSTDPCAGGAGGGVSGGGNGVPCPPPNDCNPMQVPDGSVVTPGTITSPADNFTYNAGDSIMCTATAGQSVDSFHYVCQNPNATQPPPPPGSTTSSVTPTWSDNGANGTFDSATSLSTTYHVDPNNPPDSITLLAQYPNAPSNPSVTGTKEVTVEFSDDPVKAGLTAPGGGTSVPQNEDLRGTVTATITPKAKAPGVSFDTSDHQKATVAEDPNNPRADQGNSTIVTLKVTGVAMTPVGSPGGDVDLQAKRNGNVIKTAKIKVIIPKTQVHQLINTTFRNLHFPTIGGFTLATFVAAVERITIKDQFGDVLDQVYDADNCVSEEFPANDINGHNFFPNGETLIVQPNNQFRSGIKDDLIGFTPQLFTAPGVFDADKADKWDTYHFNVNGFDNAVGATLQQDQVGDGKQIIRVHGYTVTPDYRRFETLKKANHDPIPFTVQDKTPP